MFPTTIWTTIERAGGADRDALGRLASRYRPAIHGFARQRGLAAVDADDICQEVFLRLLKSDVLSRADPARGRFRSLLLAIARHVILDRKRKRAGMPLVDEPPAADASDDVEFDSQWTLQLTALALEKLEAEGSPYVQVLREHLTGQKPDRNKLWIARKKLIAGIRQEIALTTRSHAEFEQEVAYLSRYLHR